MMNAAAKKKPVLLFITGAFLSHTVWEGWSVYFRKKGYRTLAPPWPEKECSASRTSQHYSPDGGLGQLTLDQLLDYYTGIARGLDQKPVVIGHSLGGLVAQVLLNRDIACAAAALHSFPVHRSLSLRLALSGPFRKLLRGGRHGDTCLMTTELFSKVIGNGMALRQQQRAYEMFIVPESRQVVRDALLRGLKLDFRKEQGPLLLTAGLLDNLIPAQLCRCTYRKYKKKRFKVRYATFFTSHSVLTHVGWKAEADYVERWITAQIRQL